MAHILMENRNDLVVHAVLTHATGTAEREAALIMVEDVCRFLRTAEFKSIDLWSERFILAKLDWLAPM